jgi:glutamine amidotransferase-like uncharacterized protein
LKKKTVTKRASVVVQGVGPEFKPQYSKRKKEKKKKDILQSLNDQNSILAKQTNKKTPKHMQTHVV